MIQRPQSILLFLTAVLYGLMAFAPLWQLSLGDTTITLTATMATVCITENETCATIGEITNVYLLAACACGVILSVVTIFLFKNRPLQAKISALNAIIIMGFVGLSIVFAIPNAKLFIKSSDLDNGAFLWGFYLSIGILLLIVVTNKLIRKDEALVKSVDRIR